MIHRLSTLLHPPVPSGAPAPCSSSTPQSDDSAVDGRACEKEVSTSTSGNVLGIQPEGGGTMKRRPSVINEWRKNHNFPVHLVGVSISTYAILVYFLWVWVGIIFYMLKNKWDIGTAYYYAVEAGLSVGYCEPAEPDDASKLFTIFYILSGSTLVAGSLGALVSRMIAAKAFLSPTRRKHEEATFRDQRTGRFTLRSVTFKLWYEIKLSVGWWEHRDRVKILSAFIIWLGFGTAYCMVVERWSFVTSLYWAVSACSTGGLQSAPCEPGTSGTTCSMGYFRGGMMGTYMLLGVPIYACTMAMFGSIAIRKAVVQDRINMLAKPISEIEFRYCANILSPAGSVTLNCGEFMLMELMRLKAVTADDIERFKMDFEKLDSKHSGVLSIEDLRAEGRVVQPKRKSTYYNQSLPRQVSTTVALIRSASFDIASSVGSALFKSPIKSPARRSPGTNMYDDPDKSVHETDEEGGDGGHFGEQIEDSKFLGGAAGVGGGSSGGEWTTLRGLTSKGARPAGDGGLELSAIQVTKEETVLGGIEC